MILSICTVADAQNLVPNGSFNYSQPCQPGTVSPPSFTPWFATYSTPDEYHPCYSTSMAVPTSFGGGENPVDGEGYIGLYTYSHLGLKREFISVELLTTLSQGVKYRVDFYVSLMDSARYACRNIGALFTSNSPESNVSDLLNSQHQIMYEDLDYITEKQGWERIGGEFVAEGNERFLTIGNYDDDSQIDTLLLEHGGVLPISNPDFWKVSYYYVDAVSVIPDSVYLDAGGVEAAEREFSLYPNPNSGAFSVALSLFADEQATLDVWTISGQKVYSAGLSSGTNELEMDVSSGLYLYRIDVNGSPEWIGKFSVGLD